MQHSSVLKRVWRSVASQLSGYFEQDIPKIALGNIVYLTAFRWAEGDFLNILLLWLKVEMTN